MSDKTDEMMSDWTDEEVLEILHEQYYTLISTGEDAILALVDDIVNDRFSEHHGMSDERMGIVLVKFARSLADRMLTPAMESVFGN